MKTDDAIQSDQGGNQSVILSSCDVHKFQQ